MAVGGGGREWLLNGVCVCVLVCLLVSLPACFFHLLLPCFSACLLACLPACLFACSFVCVLACLFLLAWLGLAWLCFAKFDLAIASSCCLRRFQRWHGLPGVVTLHAGSGPKKGSPMLVHGCRTNQGVRATSPWKPNK